MPPPPSPFDDTFIYLCVRRISKKELIASKIHTYYRYTGLTTIYYQPVS